MIIIAKKDGSPVMQGDTTLEDNKTIGYSGKTGIDVVCTCGKPFAESLQENGIILDSVLCSQCEKELAVILETE